MTLKERVVALEQHNNEQNRRIQELKEQARQFHTILDNLKRKETPTGQAPPAKRIRR